MVVCTNVVDPHCMGQGSLSPRNRELRCLSLHMPDLLEDEEEMYNIHIRTHIRVCITECMYVLYSIRNCAYSWALI